MPTLKVRYLFISHAWRRGEHYQKIVEWLNETSYFEWHNYSVPSHDACEQTSTVGLQRCLTNQIRPAQATIILAGMYAAYSDWIEYEVNEAVRMGKIIIGVRPWGQERTPALITDSATTMVNWQRDSVVSAVRDFV
jgi:hypothetical protein